ncbi:MAG: glycoside hydrolase family 28 protein [Prevotella sp.]
MITLLLAIINILSFGSVADNGKTNNAPAINRAIASCAEHGGGTVVVPEGTFGSGTIYLKSRVTLRLESGAVLKGSPNIDDYSPLVTTLDLSRYESGQGTVNHNSATDPEWSRSFIFCVGIDHAGIEGCGTIDGADVRNVKGEEGMRGPHTIMIVGCKNMRFSDFNVTRSANYAFLGYQINKAEFSNLTITGGWDGIHIRGGERIGINRCRLHTGDDCVAGGYWNNITISHCTLNSSCNGIRMIMPSTRVEITDCNIYSPGIYPHITSGRTSTETGINIQPGGWGKAPGRMDRIAIRRCKLNHVGVPLSVTLSEDNTCGRVLVEDVVAHDITGAALSMKSWGTTKIDKVTIRRSDFQYVGVDDPNLPAWFEGKPVSQWPCFPCYGMYFRNVGRVCLDKVKLSFTGKEYRKAVIMDNVGKHNYKE